MRNTSLDTKESVEIDSIKVLKDLFLPIVQAVAKQEVKTLGDIETHYKVIIPKEVREQYKNGFLKLMEGNDGSILPNIVNDKNRIVKQIRLEELPKEVNKDKLNQIDTLLLQESIQDIKDRLEYVTQVIDEVCEVQKNNLYAKIDGAIHTINQSFLENDYDRQKALQVLAQTQLNEGLEALKKDIFRGIKYFSKYDELNFLNKYLQPNKYTTKNIEKNVSCICKNYGYYKKGVGALIDLKSNQGISLDDINVMIEDFNTVDLQLKNANLKSWLQPQNRKNKWQYDLLNIESSDITIEYTMEEILGGLSNET